MIAFDEVQAEGIYEGRLFWATEEPLGGTGEEDVRARVEACEVAGEDTAVLEDAEDGLVDVGEQAGGGHGGPDGAGDEGKGGGGGN